MIDRPNAVLVINPPNKDQGFLLPQLTSSERNAIAPASPQDDGLVVFDTTDKSFYYWSGGAWIRGLGDSVNDVLAYDAATQSLSLSAGGTVNLSSLKEIPLQTGHAGKFLTTDGTSLSWLTVSALGDITSITTGQALSGGATSGDINLSVNTDATTISVNGSNQLQLTNGAVSSTKLASNAVNSTHIIDGTVSSADILDNTISTNDIVNGGVTGAKIASGTVTTTNISSGGNDKVLTTDGTGAVTWSDRTTFVDDNQNLGFSGNTLTIDNGTAVNLSAGGQVTGLLDNLVIQPGASNQVMTTNAAGTATVWTTPGGDVTGALNTTTVGRIQGRNVSNAAPNSGEALIWNGAAWVPTVITVPPTTQFYAVDPLNFQGSGSPITAGVNLPDGATIIGVTVYYEYTLLLGVISVDFSRKEFATGNTQNISIGGTPLLGLGIQNIGLPVNVANDLIDNSTYSYRITVSFSLPATQELHGIRIQYTK